MTPIQSLTARARRALLQAMLLILAASGAAHAQTASVRLGDVVKSSGSGTINLMAGTGNTRISAAQLEALRQEHTDSSTAVARKYLALGIDVNENAKGMESATSQGVALAVVRLTVTRPSGTSVYTDYRSRTRALIAPSGSTTRTRYYTVLGEAGSSRITASNSIQGAMDSTLDIFVPDSLSDATAAVLEIRFLDVNKSMGDPESFYDFSGGYEDLALLNREDAAYLNVTVATTSTFRSTAPAAEPVAGIVSDDTPQPAATVRAAPAAWAHFPSAGSFYMVAYEDNFPVKGDYDFNDAVVAFRYSVGFDASGKVVRVDSEAYLVADGGWYTLDWHFRLPLGGSGTASCSVQRPGATAATPCAASLAGGAFDALVFDGIDNSGSYFSGAGDWSANTVRWAPQKQGSHALISVLLDQPVAWAPSAADPWLFVRDTGSSIHLSSVDPNGFPFALLLPDSWRNPLENVDMGLAYPRFRSFVESAGKLDANWYLFPDLSQVFDIGNWMAGS